MKVLFVALCIAAVVSVAYTQDPICLGRRVLSLSDCVTQLATSPSTFCTSSCRANLYSAYADCGYTGTLNSVGALCGTGGGTSGASSVIAVPVMVVSGIVVALATLF